MKDTDKRDFFILLIAVPVIFVIAVLFVYKDSKIKKEPINYGEWQEIVNAFKYEMTLITLPPETESYEIEDWSKRGISTFLTVRYKTQILNNQFVSFLKNELEKKGWIYRGMKKDRFDTYRFCRGESEADLYFEGNGGIFAEKGNYFKLIFISSFDGNEGVSEICK